MAAHPVPEPAFDDKALRPAAAPDGVAPPGAPCGPRPVDRWLRDATWEGAGDRDRAADELVTSHLWLADSLARRFGHRGEDQEDLQQVARTGLVEAARRYDPAQGPFIGYAVPTIAGTLKRHFRDHGWMVRPPRRTQELAARMWHEWPDLVQCLGALPTESELAVSLEAPLASIRQARRASLCYVTASIDAALSRGAAFESDESGRDLDRTEARLVVRAALAQLSDQERTLLRLRFCELCSQSEIAAQFGISQMQVSRLLTRVLGKLRGMLADPEPAAEAG